MLQSFIGIFPLFLTEQFQAVIFFAAGSYDSKETNKTVDTFKTYRSLRLTVPLGNSEFRPSWLSRDHKIP